MKMKWVGTLNVDKIWYTKAWGMWFKLVKQKIPIEIYLKLHISNVEMNTACNLAQKWF